MALILLNNLFNIINDFILKQEKINIENNKVNMQLNEKMDQLWFGPNSPEILKKKNEFEKIQINSLNNQLNDFKKEVNKQNKFQEIKINSLINKINSQNNQINDLKKELKKQSEF